MKRKTLWKISVATLIEAEDAVAEMISGIFNCGASSYFDFETQTSVVSVYFSEKKLLPSDGREEILKGLRRIENCGLKIGAGKIKIAKIRREDWAESWKRHFKPIEIGHSLLIKPSWSKRRPRKKQAVVILDPGLSFGTGQHPTTEFCLREIVRASKMAMTARGDARPTKKSFLDIGTGSGILAIAAAKLGCKPIRAIDFDPEAIRVAGQNAHINKVSKKIKIARGDVSKFRTKPEERFDLVCANLISNLLIAERRKIVAQLNHDGVLVLAGILKPEFAEVQEEFEFLGLKLISSRSKKEWRSGSFVFRARKKF